MASLPTAWWPGLHQLLLARNLGLMPSMGRHPAGSGALFLLHPPAKGLGFKRVPPRSGKPAFRSPHCHMLNATWLSRMGGCSVVVEAT